MECIETEKLTKIGLTINESKVYLSLIELGTSKAGEILKRSGLNSGKIYEILNSLKNKGLISESIINNVKFFTCASPKKLYDYVERKEEEIRNERKIIDELIPKINNSHIQETSNKAVTYTGIEGMKTAIAELLDATKSGEEILTMGITGQKAEKINEFWQTFFIPKIIDKRIKQKIIFSEEENTDYLKNLKKAKSSEIRIAPIKSMVPIAIYGKNKVIISNYDEPITNIVVYNEKIAKSFIELFNQLWKLAKK